MPQSKRRFILGLLALIWLTIVVSLYYVWHKPISIPSAIRLARAFGQLATALGLLSLGGGLGVRLMRSDQTGLAWMAVQAGLGCGILSLGVLAVGTTIGVGTFIAWFAFIIMGVFLWKDVRKWWGSLKEAQGTWRDSPLFGRWIAVGLGLILLATLTTVLASPVKFDALVYHLSLPRFYLLSGRIEYTPWLIFWGMPQTGEMLYTWSTALAGEEAAASLGWLLGVVAIAGLFGLVYVRVGAAAAWVSVAALMAGFTFSASLSWAYVDWLVVLFGLGTMVLLDEWIMSNSPRILRFSGLLAGMALGSKYTGGVILLAGVVLVSWWCWQRRERIGIIFIELWRFLYPAILITLPWWIRNFLATGNPFYPLLFQGGAMDLVRLDFYNIHPLGDWRDILLLPVMATITGVEGASGYSASIGSLLIGLGVCAFLGWSNRSEAERKTLCVAATIGVFGFIVWASAARLSGMLLQSRLYTVIFPALAVLSGAGYKAFLEIQWGGIRLWRVAGALILVVWGLTVVEVGSFTLEQGAAQDVLGITSREDYLDKNLGWYNRAMRAIHNLPEDTRTLMLWEPRSLYCLPKCDPDEVIDRWKHDRTVWERAEVILDQWRSEGYSHLLFYRLGAEFVREEDQRYSLDDWKTLDKLLSNLPPPIDIGGAYYLYQLNP